MKVHLIDGTFELFRCFHGAPRVTSAEGREVGAVRGLVHTLVALLRQDDVTHLALAFDQMSGRAREGETSVSALLRSQYRLAADAVRALGIRLWPMVRFQADDALATGAAFCDRLDVVEQVVVCTTDKDLMQCVRGERVVVLDRIRKRTTDEAGVVERFGVEPRLIPELFALIGDPSDGLTGIPGWGPKSAAPVLNRYRRIEDIPRDPETWEVTVRGAARLSRALNERWQEAVLMRDLSILRDDLPVMRSISELEWRGADRAATEGLCARIDTPEIIERVPRWRSI